MRLFGRRKKKHSYYDQVYTGKIIDGGPLPSDGGSNPSLNFFDNPTPHFFSQPHIKYDGGQPLPRFDIGQLVIVNSIFYGRWMARIDDREYLGSSWRYDVSDRGLHVTYGDPGLARRSNVHEESLERFSRSVAARRDPGADWGLWGFTSGFSALPLPPTGSVEAMAAWNTQYGPVGQAASVLKRWRERPAWLHAGEVVFNKRHWAEQALLSDAQQRTEVLTTPEIKRRFLLQMIKAHSGAGNDYVAEELRGDLLQMWHEDLFPDMTVWEVMKMTEEEYESWIVLDFSNRKGW